MKIKVKIVLKKMALMMVSLPVTKISSQKEKLIKMFNMEGYRMKRK